MYRFDYWAYHIHSELNRQSQHIRAVLSDQDAATLFAAKHYKLHNINLGTIIPYSELPLSEKVEAIETVSSRLSDALATYDDQMCVLIYSYIEATIEEFFAAVFATHPDKMSPYIKDHFAAQNPGNGALDIFQRILRSESREQFVNEMARIAAKQATNGGNAPGKIMHRIAALLKADEADHRHVSLTDSLTRLKEHRNILVHEPSFDFEFKIAIVETVAERHTTITRTPLSSKILPDEALETYQRLIYYLGDLCLKNQVPVYDAPPGATGLRLVSADELPELNRNLLPEEICDGYYTHWTSD